MDDEDRADGTRVYTVHGQVFSASTVQFANSFHYLHAEKNVVIGHKAHFWDTSAVAALDRLVLKLRRPGAEVEVTGLNQASGSQVDRLNTHRSGDHACVSGQ